MLFLLHLCRQTNRYNIVFNYSSLYPDILTQLNCRFTGLTLFWIGWVEGSQNQTKKTHFVSKESKASPSLSDKYFLGNVPLE